MQLYQSFILGVVQGITEFLPISSSAHLILTSKLLGWQDQGLTFDITLHFGSLIAVVIYFRTYVIKCLKGFINLIANKKTTDASLTKKIIVATLPILTLGLFIEPLANKLFREQIAILAVSSIIWAVLLYFADKRKSDTNSVESISYKAAFYIGLAQVFAIIPGTSRSGSTITIGRFLNISRKVSAEFSMLMSIPVILLASVAKLYKIISFSPDQLANINTNFFLIGIFTSFIFALLTIHFLIKLIERTSYMPFVIYRIILGVIVIFLIY